MDKYYYLAAQLPVLRFDQDLPIEIDAFLNEAQKWLPPTDYRLLKEANINTTAESVEDPPELKSFKRFENGLRTELSHWRKAYKQRLEYKPTAFPIALLKEGNPLEIEINLLSLRWDFLNDLEFGHYSDLDFLIIYLLKLQILLRRRSFDKMSGLEKFQTYTEIGL